MPNSKSTVKGKTLKPSTVRVGRRYRPTRVDDHYDAIVIGSGIGGMSSAACLAKQGKKVAVLEQHYTAGGYTHTYARNGYEWDVGVHYIGDMGSANTLGRKVFDYITDGKLKWAPMDANYDRFYLGDKQFDLYAGKKEFKLSLLKHFPEERKAINSYMKMLSKVSQGMSLYTMSKALPPSLNIGFKALLKHRLPSYFNKTTYEVLSSLTDNEELIGVLTGQWGDCGVPPKQSSFLIHSLIAKHYLRGGYYPVGGASQIAETIIPVVQSGGGDIFTYADVAEILVKNNRAVGVKMADGHEIHAPLVISNAGVINTYEKLLPDHVAKRCNYTRNSKTIESSMAHIGMYIGLKGTAKELGLPKTNYWIYLDEHHDANVENFIANQSGAYPVVYISFPSAKDPSYQQRYPGRSAIEIVAPTSYEMFEQWKETPWSKRGEEYETLKEEISTRLLEEMYKKLPQLRGKVDYYETSTPLSTDYFCRYSRGELYGLNHTPQRFEQDWLRPKSKVKGLYLTGQDVLSCGVVSAMIAGMMTTVSINARKSLPMLKQIFINRAEGAKLMPFVEAMK
ncbi:MAG: phytoene desaturase family protein [Pseudomonadales bacterium]